MPETAKTALKAAGLDPKMVRTDRLKPVWYNPRDWTDEEMANLKASLWRFGFVEPLVVNARKGRWGNVVGGHFRLAAAKEMGIEEVPVVFVSLDKRQERDLNLRLNRNVGDWDWKALAEFAASDLEAAGFSMTEIEGMKAAPKAKGSMGPAPTKYMIPLEFDDPDAELEARRHFTGPDVFAKTDNLIRHYAGQDEEA